jgi:hypothetical protein
MRRKAREAKQSDAAARTKGKSYFSGRTSGAAEASPWISWNCGSGRSFDGFESLVQQQEATIRATLASINAGAMRDMVVGGCFLVFGKYGEGNCTTVDPVS